MLFEWVYETLLIFLGLLKTNIIKNAEKVLNIPYVCKYYSEN